MYKNCTLPPRSRRATNPTPDRPEGGSNIFLYIVAFCVLFYIFYSTCYMFYSIEDALAGRHRQTTLGKRPWPWQSAVVLGHCGQNISGVLVNLARTWQEPGSN